MVIYPAIDLRDGKCVRLYKGDFATTKVYNDNPAAMLEEFAAAGSEWCIWLIWMGLKLVNSRKVI